MIFARYAFANISDQCYTLYQIKTTYRIVTLDHGLFVCCKHVNTMILYLHLTVDGSPFYQNISLLAIYLKLKIYKTESKFVTTMKLLHF